jgi:FtsZ-binding cell division protein ZapB
VSDFDPIPRLQQIAATIEDGGRFDSPATAAHYITCAIREIERLRQENAIFTAEHDALRAERDEIRRSYCSLMEAYRGGDGRVTANKLGWGYLFEEGKPCQ